MHTTTSGCACCAWAAWARPSSSCAQRWRCIRDVLAHNNLGFALSSLGRYEEAIEQFQAVVEIDTSDLYTLTNLGLSFSRLGNRPATLECYSQPLPSTLGTSMRSTTRVLR